MLARRDGLEGDLDMRFRDRQIEDDFDRGVVEQGFDRTRGNSKLLSARFGGGGVGVRKGDDLEDRKFPRRLQIGAADDAATDDSHPDALHGESPAVTTDARGRRAGPVVPQGAP